MIRARATRPRRKPTVVSPEPRPDPLACTQEPPSVLPESLVRSTLLRLEHAVRWANWPMVLRVCQDARRAHEQLAHELLQPIEQRPIEALNALAGLPRATVYALRTLRNHRGPLQTVQDVLDYGEIPLTTAPGMTWQRAEEVLRAIERARATIDREIDRQACWTIIAR